MTHRVARDRGAVTTFAAVMAVALIMVAGMAYDGGQIIAAQADARSAAAKAARAGAQQIDLTALRATGDTTLDPHRAETAARDYLDQAHTTGTITVDGSNITVTVTINQPMHILPAPDRTVTATHTATALDEVTP